MEISLDMIKDGNVIVSPQNNKYDYVSFIHAVDEFNKQCPKIGGVINRTEIGHFKDPLHTTTCLRYENNKLIATIDKPVDKDYVIKPIISTPLCFGSGVDIKYVIKIVNIFLEKVN